MRYSGMLMATCRRYVKDEAAAKDVLEHVKGQHQDEHAECIHFTTMITGERITVVTGILSLQATAC